MNATLKSEINALITTRILAYNSLLIETGQIKTVELKGPSATPTFSRCIQSEHTHLDAPLEGLVPL
uniref:Uncharacterized protein n=1 Tax=viral metagenome TaxID=1070528 RepID=A0A6H1ZS85_9ZZZZ